MRVLFFSGDTRAHPEHAECLRDSVRPGESTVVDLLRITDYDAHFMGALFFFLKRCLTARSDVVLVADGKMARRLQAYGILNIARIVDNREAGIKLAATLDEATRTLERTQQRRSGSRRVMRANTEQLYNTVSTHSAEHTKSAVE
jgi:hypothetical protein